MRLEQYLRERSDEVGDCWEWNRAVQTSSGCPVMRYEGKAQAVRRVIAVELGMALDGRLAAVKCANAKCVNPAHVVVLTRKQLQQRTAKLTHLHANPARCRKLAAKARQTGKLTEEQVAEIRAIEGMKQRDIAALYGVTQATVSAIRRGVKWKDYGNPWLGLLKGKA